MLSERPKTHAWRPLGWLLFDPTADGKPHLSLTTACDKSAVRFHARKYLSRVPVLLIAFGSVETGSLSRLLMARIATRPEAICLSMLGSQYRQIC